MSESSLDDQPLSVFVRHKPKYRVDISDKYFNGRIVRVNCIDAQCHIKYCDSDSEIMSEGEIEQYIMRM